MFSDKAKLYRFIIEHRVVRDGDIRPDLALLEPFFRKAEAGMFDLAPAAEQRIDAAAASLSNATGADIASVSFLSLEDGAKPLRGEAAAAFWEAHARELSADVKGYLWRRNMGALETALGRELLFGLEHVLWRAIGEPLWHSFEKDRWNDTGNALRLVIRANLLETLLQFTGFLILGDERRLESLRPLVRLMATAMPIGERRDTPGAWTTVAG